MLQLSVDDITANADVYGDSAEHSGNYDQLKVHNSLHNVLLVPSVFLQLSLCILTFKSFWLFNILHNNLGKIISAAYQSQ